MASKSDYRAGAILLCAVAGVVLVVLLTTRPSLLDRARNVRDGMAQAEVERVMGRPPDIPASDATPATWVSGNDTFEVEYHGGRVSNRNFFSTYVTEASGLDRLRDWLGL